MTNNKGFFMRQLAVKMTDKQLSILRLIIKSTLENGFQPNNEEIAKQAGTTRQAVADKIKQLCRKGVLKLSVASGERCVSIMGVRFVPVIDKKKLPDEHGEEIVAMLKSLVG
jgi:predicted transcriptional regulator